MKNPPLKRKGFVRFNHKDCPARAFEMDTIPFQQIRHEANAHCRQSGLAVGCRRAPSVMVLSDEKHFRGELGAHPPKTSWSTSNECRLPEADGGDSSLPRTILIAALMQLGRGKVAVPHCLRSGAESD